MWILFNKLVISRIDIDCISLVYRTRWLKVKATSRSEKLLCRILILVASGAIYVCLSFLYQVTVNEENCVLLVGNSDWSKLKFLIIKMTEVVKLVSKIFLLIKQKWDKNSCTQFSPFTCWNAWTLINVNSDSSSLNSLYVLS